jgi:hypothetical protein
MRSIGENHVLNNPPNAHVRISGTKLLSNAMAAAAVKKIYSIVACWSVPQQCMGSGPHAETLVPVFSISSPMFKSDAGAQSGSLDIIRKYKYIN